MYKKLNFNSGSISTSFNADLILKEAFQSRTHTFSDEAKKSQFELIKTPRLKHQGKYVPSLNLPYQLSYSY